MSKLKELRKSKGMTQPELAELAGVSLKALQAYEQDYRPIDRASAENVYRLAKTLGTTIEDLLGVESLTSDNQNARTKSAPIIDRDLYERAQAKLLEKKENAYIPPLGYKEQDGKLVVNEEEAEVVKRAFSEMSRDGRVSPETEKELRRLWARHYRPKEWTEDTVRKAAKADKEGAAFYLGEIKASHERLKAERAGKPEK